MADLTSLENWLKIILKQNGIENVKITSMEAIGKGNNYLGDIFFVQASGESQNDKSMPIIYDIVLKTSKKAPILRETTRMNALYLNEIFVYKTILPYFLKYQSDLDIEDPFDNFPKCFGTFADKAVEVIALENLKKQDYYLWERKDPMPKNYIHLVLEAYGKLHATSAAIAYHCPEKFQSFCETSNNLFSFLTDGGKSRLGVFIGGIKESYNVIKDDVDYTTAKKWLDLADKVESKFINLRTNTSQFKVTGHGDCWNNNFMFKSEVNNKNQPSHVVILDWQLSKPSSPTFDLAYFLFSCISFEDFDNIDFLLNIYYSSFASHLKKFDCDPDEVFSKKQFFEDWKEFCVVGAFFCPMALKLSCLSEEDEIPNFVEVLEKKFNFSDMVTFSIKDVENYKKRMKPVVEYLVNNKII